MAATVYIYIYITHEYVHTLQFFIQSFLQNQWYSDFTISSGNYTVKTDIIRYYLLL